MTIQKIVLGSGLFLSSTQWLTSSHIDLGLDFLNSKFNIECQTKVYHVVSDKTNKIFHIYEDRDEFITSSEQLNKIDSFRILKKHPSIYKLQNGDTLNVKYKIGLFKVKFLE